MTRNKSGQPRIEAMEERGWTPAAGARLKMAVREANWRQEKLAEVAGVSRSTLDAIFRGKSTPRQTTIEAICEVIGIDIDDLIDGTMPSPTYGPPDLSLPLSGDVRLGEHEYNLIKRYEVRVSAGSGLIPSTEFAGSGIAFPRSWLLQRGIAADLAGLVRVKGDSMAPTIPDAATVLIQFMPTIAKAGIYVFRRDGEIFLKRIQPLSFSEDGRVSSLAVISDNAAYPPEVITGAALSDLRIIGQVRTMLVDM